MLRSRFSATTAPTGYRHRGPRIYGEKYARLVDRHCSEHHYALCDLPIPALYDKLDKAYPGSKFILTTRPDGKWLNSVQKHFDEHFNPVREGWGRDVFSHRIHNEIYGRTDFDAETFLAAYKKHNAAVLEYFKDRPNDLLVMNMDKNAGWESLCTFLGKPVPSEPYPVRNIGKS